MVRVTCPEGSLPGVSDLSIPIRLWPEAQPPEYAHDGDAGADLRIREPVTLAPGERVLVGTGVAAAIPPGYVGLVHPRSGLAHRHGLSIVNAPGVIDSGYRGEIMLNLINLDRRHAVTLEPGERVAQLLVQRVEIATFAVVEELETSERRDRGHGSTGR